MTMRSRGDCDDAPLTGRDWLLVAAILSMLGMVLLAAVAAWGML